LPNAQWEFVVFDSPEMNAFCLPGGKVGVYSGILAVTQTEAGLATVLGHEVAHASQNHGAERMSEALVLQGVGSALGAATPEKYSKATMMAYGLGAKVGRELPHGRKQESEADEVGLLYMARSGYDPREALKFWERFSTATEGKGGGTPWFLRTHPVTADRITDLKQLMPAAVAEYERAKGGARGTAPSSSGSTGGTVIGR
jgi:metalloendopeptidase OMA1, mitochondrial